MLQCVSGPTEHSDSALMPKTSFKLPEHLSQSHVPIEWSGHPRHSESGMHTPHLSASLKPKPSPQLAEVWQKSPFSFFSQRLWNDEHWESPLRHRSQPLTEIEKSTRLLTYQDGQKVCVYLAFRTRASNASLTRFANNFFRIEIERNQRIFIRCHIESFALYGLK